MITLPFTYRKVKIVFVSESIWLPITVEHSFIGRIVNRNWRQYIVFQKELERRKRKKVNRNFW